MNLNHLAMIQQLKSGIATFKKNHPKFPLFLDAVARDALKEGTVVEIKVCSPDGKSYVSNLKLTADDIALIESFRGMNR